MWKLSESNYGAPKSPDVVKNPQVTSAYEAQAWSYNGNWYYNYKGATTEVGFRWERLPTIDELMNSINSVDWDNENKSNTLSIPFSWYTGAPWSIVHGFWIVAFIHSSSVEENGDTQCVRLGKNRNNFWIEWISRKCGLSVRTYK